MTELAVRQLLEAERSRTVERLRALDTEFGAIVAASVGSNTDDEHDPEGATIAFERERTSALRAQAQAHLRLVDQALSRAADGSYGLCRRCQSAIPEERLRALPATELCAPCAGGQRSGLRAK